MRIIPSLVPGQFKPLLPGSDEGSFEPLPLAPPRVFAMGLSYAAHCIETGEPPLQSVFEKGCTPRAGPGTLATPDAAALFGALAALDRPLAEWMRDRGLLAVPLLDYEVELGLALLADVQRSQLADRGFAPPLGFFVANDVTARTVQVCGEGTDNRMDYWAAAKSLPGFLPVSPAMWVPAAPVVDGLMAARLETRVGDSVRQSGLTLGLMWTPREMLARLCDHFGFERLARGTWLLTGTPAGVAMNVTARQRRVVAQLPRRWAIHLAISANRRKAAFLRPGARVSCGVQGQPLLTVETLIS